MLSLENIKIILGSGSPRRKELLQSIVSDFEVVSINADESFSDDMPCTEVAEYLSVKKSKAFEKPLVDTLLITADTTVVSNDEILGKPVNEEEAFQMISTLSGNYHEVITGVCLRTVNKQYSFSSTTKVWFRPLQDTEIRHYIEHYRPFDKAGGYGIQEWIGMIAVEKIEGSYYNVVGLPACQLYTSINKFIS